MPHRPLALVTGGCRRLGAAIAARLAGEGYDLALQARSGTVIEAALAAALGESGTDWAVFESDFEQAGAATLLHANVTGHFGRRPDLIVNNAALFSDDDLDSADPASVERHMAINLAAPLALMQAATSGEGRAVIVNILDQRLAHLHGDQLSYSLSKAALAALDRIAGRHPRLRVNAVAPGLSIPTDDYAPDQLQRLAALMPLAALPKPRDIAEAVSFLAGAGWARGQTLYVDGGAHLVAFPCDFVKLAR